MKKHSSKSNSLLPIFTERFCSLFREGETQEAFGNRVGLVRNTVAQYYNGHRIPDSITLRQICERCNVSADWLLGLAKVKKPDITLQAVCQYTGLSEVAIQQIRDLEPSVLNTLELVLMEKSNIHFLHTLDAYLNKKFDNPYVLQEDDERPKPLFLPFVLYKQSDDSYFTMTEEAYVNYLLKMVTEECERLRKEVKEVKKDGKS